MEYLSKKVKFEVHKSFLFVFVLIVLQKVVKNSPTPKIIWPSLVLRKGEKREEEKRGLRISIQTFKKSGDVVGTCKVSIEQSKKSCCTTFTSPVTSS